MVVLDVESQVSDLNDWTSLDKGWLQRGVYIHGQYGILGGYEESYKCCQGSWCGKSQNQDCLGFGFESFH